MTAVPTLTKPFSPPSAAPVSSAPDGRAETVVIPRPLVATTAAPATPSPSPVERVSTWLTELADDGRRFETAVKQLTASAVDADAIGTLRDAIRNGGAESIVTQVATAMNLVETPQSPADDRLTGTAALANTVGVAIGAALGVEVSPQLARAFGAHIEPNRAGDLEHYLAHVPDIEADAPTLFNTAGLAYTSTPLGLAPVSTEDIRKDYIAAWIGTPPEIAQMDDAGIANMLAPEWRAAVVTTARQNGGLGNATDGYLAFSRDYGFVRLRNHRLSPEQNRRLAEMSLTLGVSIDTLPSRTHDSSFTNSNAEKWVNEIIGRYDEQIAQFQADPKDAVEVKDGSKRYVMKLDEDSGRVVSYDYKKSGGFRGFAQRNIDIIGPVLDVASVVVNFVPGLGQGAAVGLQGLKTGLSVAATGELTAGHVAGFAGSLLPGLRASGALSATQAAAISGSLRAGSQLIDTGEFDAAGLLSAVAPSLVHGLPGGPEVDRVVQGGIRLAANAVSNGTLDIADAFRLVTLLDDAFTPNTVPQPGGTPGPTTASSGLGDRLDGLRNDITAGLGIDRSVVEIVEDLGPVVFDAVRRGEVRGSDLAKVFGGFADSITDDDEAQDLIRAALLTIGSSIDQSTVAPAPVYQSLIPAIRAFFTPDPARDVA